MMKLHGVLIWMLLMPIFVFGQQRGEIRIGSKLFTESVILGEITTQIARSEGLNPIFYEQLGGTRILWNALLEGELDIYPEYTGTIIQEILQEPDVESFEALKAKLAGMGIALTQPLGFNNTYALGMKKDKAEQLGISSISDLASHPDINLGFSNEFIERADGWAGLKEAYKLTGLSARGLDHDLAYRGLDAGDIDVIDLYSTDAEIDYYDLKVLQDDINFFPRYDAVFVYRLELEDVAPGFVSTIKTLEGRVDEATMVGMNAQAKLDQVATAIVASSFLKAELDIQTEVKTDGWWQRLQVTTAEHLYLVGISLFLAILIAIPLGIIAAKVPFIEQVVIGGVGILQTIPSLALLVFMIPLFGIGALPAMAALFLYSLLPIVRNTHAGLKNIPTPLMESAQALGLPNKIILKKIELPLASSTILAGIKTSAVINVGTATLGALIGAGGYGQPILTGIRLDSIPLILEGAIPAAVLALLVQYIFDIFDRN